MDALLDLLMGFAVEMLEQHGEFFPFAGVITANGELQQLGGYTGDEHPASADVLQLLEDGLRERGDDIRAAAVASDVRVADEATGADQDAVRVHIEHREGDAVDVYLPYVKKRLKGVEFGDIYASPADGTILR
jgi:hypothetical protein